eukprot:12664666-Prorocentrum_lima.AAC.1
MAASSTDIVCFVDPNALPDAAGADGSTVLALGRSAPSTAAPKALGYECIECHDRFHRTDFLPDLEPDGQVRRNAAGNVMGRCFDCGVGKGPLAQPSTESWFWNAKTQADTKRRWRRESKKRHRAKSGLTYLDCRRSRDTDFA